MDILTSSGNCVRFFVRFCLQQAWEEKHITLPLVCLQAQTKTCITSHNTGYECTFSELLFPHLQGSDGLAGFSVVGGRDQPQLPNPGAFIVTTVNSGGPADGIIKLVQFCSFIGQFFHLHGD